jgi:hypothetical protein
VFHFKNNRDFGYLPEMIAILRDHMRESHGDDGALIRRIIEAKVAEGAEKLYYYGLKTDRVFATRVLLKLLAGNPASPVVAVFLAGLWCPRAVTSKLGRPLRRMLFRKAMNNQLNFRLGIWQRKCQTD